MTFVDWISEPVNWVYAGIGLIVLYSGFRVVTVKNVVHAALFLVATLAGTAGLFILLSAEFVAWVLVLVYIGAVIVLFLFGIMLTKASMGDDENVDLPNRVIPAIVGTLLLAVMSFAVIDYWRDVELPVETRTTAEQVSDSIFSDFIVPFEATSVLLLAALIGAIVVARKE